MLEMHTNRLRFSFPEIHPGAVLEIDFQRTLRIPDDDKEYPLPPGLGNFLLRRIDDYADRVPADWVRHGGVMLPMYQAEALWLNFRGPNVEGHGVRYPFAVKVGTGKVSAVTGESWQSGLVSKDYLNTPKQPWLDGYNAGNGIVRQFIAAPLGWGFTAEEQITGKAEHGGIQIEVFPMKREVFEQQFPKLPPPRRIELPRGTRRYTARLDSMSARGEEEFASAAVGCAAMGIAPGGQMKQQIFEDTYGLDAWNTSVSAGRCFVHLANSLAWRAITKEEAPSTPMTAQLYSSYGYPWFDYYRDDTKSLPGTEKISSLKSVLNLGFQKGLNILPENESANPERVVVLHPAPNKDAVRTGEW